MSPDYRLTKLAQSDLDEIWDYIADDSPAAADRLLATFAEHFALLSRHPLIGELRDDLRPNLRCFPVKNYVIYFQLAGERLTIVRVLHGARDVTAIF